MLLNSMMTLRRLNNTPTSRYLFTRMSTTQTMQVSLIQHRVAYFGAAAPEPLSITQLEDIGKANLAQTKPINYEQLLSTEEHGIKNKPESFNSFED